MVYGGFLALDAPLWKFWNIMKNFANFTLWFMVLFSIIKSIFSWEKWTKAPLKIIQNALIAGVLIQASWFLLAAVVDVSTVATYAIWGLPLSVLENNDELGNKPIVAPHSTFDLQNYENLEKYSDNFDVWYSYGEAKKISKCEVKEHHIIGLANGSPEYSNELHTQWAYPGKDLELCMYGNILYAFDEPDELNNEQNAESYATALWVLWDNNRSYFIIDSPATNCPTDTSKLESSPHARYGVDLANCSNKMLAQQRAKKRMAYQRDHKDGMTVSKIIDKGKWFTGPLVTMYASLLNFAEISDIPKDAGNSWAMWIELLIKTIFALALLIPLLVMCIVLLLRIGIIWLYIAFIPFLILIWVFGWDSSLDGLWKLKDMVSNPWKVAGIIFAPVIIVFALSISVIFMTALNNSLSDTTKQHEFFKNLNMNYDEKTQDLTVAWGISTMIKWDDSWSDFDTIKNFSSWLFMNLFGIALIWAILFAAIKVTALWEAVNSKLNADKRLGKWLWAIPIVSIKWQGVWLSALGNVVPWAVTEHANKRLREDETAVESRLNPQKNKEGPSTETIQQYEQLHSRWLDDSQIQKALWYSAKEIKWSPAYTNYQNTISWYKEELNDSWLEQWATIDPRNTVNMSKWWVLHAIRTGKLNVTADQWIQTKDWHYVVSQSPSWMWWYTWDLVKVPDDADDNKKKALAQKRAEEMFQEQKELAKKYEETQKTLRNMNKPSFTQRDQKIKTDEEKESKK